MKTEIECPDCEKSDFVKHGLIRVGNASFQRYFCKKCLSDFRLDYPVGKVDRSLLAELIIEGSSMFEISKKLSVAPSTISRYLIKASYDGELMSLLKVRCFQLLIEGANLETISEGLKVNKTIVRNWIDHYVNVKLRDLPRLPKMEYRIQGNLNGRIYSKVAIYESQYPIVDTLLKCGYYAEDIISSKTGKLKGYELFRAMRLFQLYLNGLDIEDLMPILRFRRLASTSKLLDLKLYDAIPKVLQGGLDVKTIVNKNESLTVDLRDFSLEIN